MKINVKRQDGIILFVSTLLIFFYSVYVSGLSISGDQLKYNNVYSSLKEKTILGGYLLYATQLSKTEITHFLIIYLGSFLNLDKVIYMSFFNSLLFAFASKCLNKIGLPLLFCVFIVGTNYYTQMLFFTAERLKFGFLFFFVALVFYENKKSSKFFIFLSILSHLQMLILWGALSGQLFFEKTFNILKKLKVKKAHLLLILFIAIIAPFLAPQIISKLSFYIVYYADSISMGILKWAIFYSLTMISSRNKINITIIYFILLIPFLIVGGERLVIFCYILFYMQYKCKSRYFKFVAFPLFLYFFIKSIPFISNIYLFGDGFA
jgi:hypothetical protein